MLIVASFGSLFPTFSMPDKRAFKKSYQEEALLFEDHRCSCCEIWPR